MKGQSIELAWNGVTLKGATQPELERRFTLDQSQGTPEQVLGFLLDEYHIESQWKNHLVSPRLFLLGPLKTRFGRPFHIVPRDAGAEPDLTTTDFTAEIQGHRFFHFDARHEARNIYLIGKQRERSVYFDTTSHDLEKRGIAVRVKEWQPGDGTLRSKPVRRLFVKKMGQGQDFFTERAESSVEIPENATENDLAAIANILLRHLGYLGRSETLKFTPIVEIKNNRYGADLNLRREDGEWEKIGFFTVDQYSSRVLDRPNSEWSPDVLQFEYELLPENAAFVQKREDLIRLFSHIESEFSGILSPQPKYILSQSHDDKLLWQENERAQLLNPDVEMAKAALKRLNGLPWPEALERLEVVQKHPAATMREAAIEMIGERARKEDLPESPQLYQLLLTLMHDPSQTVAYKAAQIFGWRATTLSNYEAVAIDMVRSSDVSFVMKGAVGAGLLNTGNIKYFDLVYDSIINRKGFDPADMWEEVQFYQWIKGILLNALQDSQYSTRAEKLRHWLVARLVQIRDDATNDARHYSNGLLYDLDRSKYLEYREYRERYK